MKTYSVSWERKAKDTRGMFRVVADSLEEATQKAPSRKVENYSDDLLAASEILEVKELGETDKRIISPSDLRVGDEMTVHEQMQMELNCSYPIAICRPSTENTEEQTLP